MSNLFIAWTTLEKLPEAETLARNCVKAGLAACVQIDGPIRSFYRWDNVLCESTEYRLSFKFVKEHHNALTEWIHQHHPYEVPEWIVVHADNIGEKYLSWARQSSNSQPFYQSTNTLLNTMSQHKSLQGPKGIVVKRNVLKRFERVALLKKRGQWEEGARVLGLRKTKPEV